MIKRTIIYSMKIARAFYGVPSLLGYRGPLSQKERIHSGQPSWQMSDGCSCFFTQNFSYEIFSTRIFSNLQYTL